jgi:hypothetical protein
LIVIKWTGEGRMIATPALDARAGNRCAQQAARRQTRARTGSSA